ncbi:MAG TPA: bifunctional hydroxymethylpyrimidine kinase/phosphomethylpyrimidine kinase [Candidatus Coprenecus stercoravium]|uniref:hydroxymethylpyrimidine kinase n=1 Tax=Candidatus Coprenecus stercoravium TaxID=2840735 RepID=A0A9D2GQ17_9BACT|nr:bifunctional hydroxymethylpyrimidine kinase/phosphomethylpyrimidine kinase [Candidatus Coprenecus stercoravium]
MKDYPIVLSIAGSDPSGGAGIQADIKAISACGGYAAAAITAVTVQNTQGVKAVDYVPAKIVGQQIDAVMSDLAVDAVKIGMTGTVPIVKAIAAQLSVHPVLYVVTDPVMVSTSKDSLAMPEAVDALCSEIIPKSHLITPNIDEASRLAGRPLKSLDDMASAAAGLHQRYGCAVLVKGGDLNPDQPGPQSVDILCDNDGVVMFQSDRIQTHNLHGTGCTLSSAVATFLGAGRPLREAVSSGIGYVHNAIVAAANLKIGHGHGPLRHFYR